MPEFAVKLNSKALVIGLGENTILAARDRALAEIAANTALAAGNFIDGGQAAAEAATSEGDFFSYSDGAGGIVYAVRDAVGSTEIAQAATKALIDTKADSSDLPIPITKFGASSSPGVDPIVNAQKIQDALDSTNTHLVIPDGEEFLVANDGVSTDFLLTSTLAGRIISGTGKIVATSRVKRLFHATGDNTNIELHIEGSNLVSNAIRMSGASPRVRGTIENLNGFTDQSAIAVFLELNGLDTDYDVDVLVRNVNAEGDGIPGGGIGQARGVLVQNNQAMTKPGRIAGAYYDIMGEEGDSIVIASTDGAGNYFDMPCLIDPGIVVDGWSRRAVKVQAGRVTVNGYYTNDLPSSLPSLQRAIDFVEGSNNAIGTVIMDRCKYQTQVGAQFDAGSPENGFSMGTIIIKGLGAETTSNLVNFRTYGEGVSIANLIVDCPNFAGISLRLVNCLNPSVGNVLNRTTTENWYDFSSSTNVRLGKFIPMGRDSNYGSYYDVAKEAHVFDVTSGSAKSVEVWNRDTVLSDGEVVGVYAFRQNDSSDPDSVNASVAAIAEGTAGALGVGIFTGDNSEKWRFRNNGTLQPIGNNTQALGASTNQISLAHIGAVYSGGIKVLGTQGSAISTPTGGSTVDTEARAAISSILSRLRNHGLIAT